MELLTQSQDSAPLLYPSPAWRAAFRAQMTPAVMERAIAAVEALLDGPYGRTCSVSAEDLVHDALVATGHGEITWRPDRVPLWVHLRDRARAELRRHRARAAREVHLDECDDDGAEAMSIERDRLAVTPDLPAALDLHRAMQAEEAKLWHAAGRDQGALAVLSARSQGHFDNLAIARASGLAVAAVAKARRRLARIARLTRHRPHDRSELAS